MTITEERPTKNATECNHGFIWFPWPTDFGRGIECDMTAAGKLLCAAREECAPCMRKWGAIVADDPYASTHLLGSSWARCQQYGIPAKDIYRTDAAAILAPMVEDDIDTMIDIAERTPKPRRYDIINDALSILIADYKDLMEYG